MKIAKRQEANIFINGACKAFEYPLDDKDINAAVIQITGRYPEKGNAVNELCKELAYIMKGSGRLVVEDKEYNLEEKDSILINAGERFFWEGDMEIFMPCTPAWYPEQHKEVE